MTHSVIISRIDHCFFMPCRVSIPGNHINFFCNFKVIQTSEIMHQICGCRKCASTLSQRGNLLMNEVCCLMSNKTFPVQVQCMKLCLTNFRRTFNLIKTVVSMAPECCAPLIIQVFNRLIFLFQPVTKCFLAKRTMAFSAILI